ncbi:type VII secretion target [Actinoplanes sp. NPDC051633]|uniref:type VII secretion target n=1 Tax=Actinoplanes sp. NPDC051633 TaxID=3155670 RepID=UPI003425F261
MSGFDVQIGQLRSAAKAAGSAADQARAVNPGTGLEAIATALPGGVAATRASTLASTFNDRAKEWADEIDRWSESVTSAAKEYSESDDSAKRAFGG